MNNNFVVYRVTTNAGWGIEWNRVRYLGSKEEAVDYVEYRKQHNPSNAKFFIVHKSQEELFNQKMQEKLNEWLAKNKARKQVSAIDYNCGTPIYACRMNSHGYSFARATKIA